MRPNQRSRTAEATAALRAAHQLLDGEPLLLVDPFAELKPGSELVFDFWSELERRPADRALLQALRFSVAGMGEQMISFFDPDSINQLVSEAGLETVEILDRREVGSRCLTVRRDGLVMPDFSFLAKVRVAGSVASPLSGLTPAG